MRNAVGVIESGRPDVTERERGRVDVLDINTRNFATEIRTDAMASKLFLRRRGFIKEELHFG